MSCSSHLPFVAFLAVSGWIAGAAHGQPLQLSRTGLDPTFGNNGTVILNPRGEADIALSLAVQSDLRILYGGWSDAGVAERLGTIMRLRPDGSPDFGFGNGGLLTSNVIQGITAIAPLPNGKIVAAGLTWNNGEPGFGVMRIFGDGRPDPTFVGGGVTYLDLSPGIDQPHRIVAQPDGKVMITGIAGASGNDNHGDFGIVRLDANGRPDPTFGTGGKVVLDFGSSTIGNTDESRALALRSDGRLVVGGSALNLLTPDRHRMTFALAQYDGAGVLDDQFGVAGKVTTRFPDPSTLHERAQVDDVLVQPDGRILAVGRGNNELVMARYTPDGILDPSFGAGGTARLRTGLSFNAGMDAAFLPDGRILVVSADRNFFAALYTQDGTLIHSALTAPRTNKTYDYLEAVELQGDGKIVGVGRVAPDSPQPGTEPWWDLNDVVVVRSIDAQQILPEPAALAGLLIAAVIFGRRRRR